jgi:hypothetical protein
MGTTMFEEFDPTPRTIEGDVKKLVVLILELVQGV